MLKWRNIHLCTIALTYQEAFETILCSIERTIICLEDAECWTSFHVWQAINIPLWWSHISRFQPKSTYSSNMDAKSSEAEARRTFDQFQQTPRFRKSINIAESNMLTSDSIINHLTVIWASRRFMRTRRIESSAHGGHKLFYDHWLCSELSEQYSVSSRSETHLQLCRGSLELVQVSHCFIHSMPLTFLLEDTRIDHLSHAPAIKYLRVYSILVYYHSSHCLATWLHLTSPQMHTAGTQSSTRT